MNATIILFGCDPEVARKNGPLFPGLVDRAATQRIDYCLPPERIASLLTDLAEEVAAGAPPRPEQDTFVPLAAAVAMECWELSNLPGRRVEWQRVAGKARNILVGDAVLLRSRITPAAVVVRGTEGWHLEGNPSKALKLIADLEAAGDFKGRRQIADSLSVNTTGADLPANYPSLPGPAVNAQMQPSLLQADHDQAVAIAGQVSGPAANTATLA